MRDERGVAAVEFALVAALLFVLVFGLIEYGLYFFKAQTLRAAAREGARVAAVGGTGDDVSAAIQRSAGETLPFTTQVTGGTSSQCTKDDDGKPVTVTIPTDPYPNGDISSAFTIEIPLIPSITIHPSISGTFRCESSLNT
jgi:Flp pilus assembly protein TadG